MDHDYSRSIRFGSIQWSQELVKDVAFTKLCLMAKSFLVICLLRAILPSFLLSSLRG